jgi:NADPH-dependent 2,4-dienoyl-CoA reductase/sulfur reductase-like enzyme/CxxC motif-containing protein
MKKIKTDIAVIGGGPAGLAAALEAKKRGAGVLILERDAELGGILQQCIHDGFGLHRFNKRMSGNQYAQVFIDEVQNSDIEVKLETMVLEIIPESNGEKTIYACNKTEGMIEIKSRAVILAMGCRERTASQVLIFGTRPAGVLTAGSIQRYINMEGFLPGKTAVILGSGDIGLIMARRMTLEGVKVKGVFEVMPTPSGLTRNIVQCLDDYGIPLALSTTVTRVAGKKRLESVTVSKVDKNLKPIPGTEQIIECDLLALAVGLIPENELTRQAGIKIDPKTKGPELDNAFSTSVPGIFACGNVAAVFDLVDYVSQSAEIAAENAVAYLSGAAPNTKTSLADITHKAEYGKQEVFAEKADSSPNDDSSSFSGAPEKKYFTCIVCPNSCRLTVWEDSEIHVEGHKCKRGLEYGANEFKNPMRMITTTVAVKNGSLTRLPVISQGEVPKNKLKDCLNELYSFVASAPITRGEIIIKNICGTGVDVIASRSMNKE